MNRTTARIGRAVIASAIVAGGIGVAAAPAAAAPHSGLVFYSGTFTTPVLHVPAPTGKCAALPATADSHAGYSGFDNVTFYRTTDCTGQATGVGTLRTYGAGQYKSFYAN
ncbi:hypothetical protein ACI2K4_18385 [Micromonospora sp. NPDC050397]|uniref:hypothetical protein n=1 Tax=Micromonospora sp. NPDC050397 TaxID=3364279 RepID=UPI00384AD4F4